MLYKYFLIQEICQIMHKPRVASIKSFLVKSSFTLMAFGASLPPSPLRYFSSQQAYRRRHRRVAMICGNLTNKGVYSLLPTPFQSTFLFLAYRSIGRSFLFHFFFATIAFAGSMILIHNFMEISFHGESLEVVVIGGAILVSALVSSSATAVP